MLILVSVAGIEHRALEVITGMILPLPLGYTLLGISVYLNKLAENRSTFATVRLVTLSTLTLMHQLPLSIYELKIVQSFDQK